MLEEKENYIYYDNIINMVYALGEEKKNAESVRRMAFKAHFSRRNMIRLVPLTLLIGLLFAVDKEGKEKTKFDVTGIVIGEMEKD